MKKQNRTSQLSETLSANGTSNPHTPSDVLDKSDPGDDTQRRFRYQHAYGAILLVGAANGNLPFNAVWCEHHEDLLGERIDGMYDAYQLKTQKPENGSWTLQKDALKKSIKKFVNLERRFPGKIHSYSFVSNVEYLDSRAADEITRSPIQFLQAIKETSTLQSLPLPFSAVFERLREQCVCPPDVLFSVLKRLSLIQGPDLDGFEAVLTSDHLPHLKGCEGLPVVRLKALRDELISMVYRASSIGVDDPSRHWSCVNGEDHLHPLLKSKRIRVTTVSDIVKQSFSIPFRFHPGSGQLGLGKATNNTARLLQKMLKGDLTDQFDTMHRRAIAAEYNLLGLALSEPERLDIILDQIVNIVQGECDEAKLHASLQSSSFGRLMLADVFNRLRLIAEHRPEMVERQTYECLIGVAGLLTGECKVWWSPPFEME